MADLLSRSRPCALEGKYELFETNCDFQGAAETNERLGDDLESFQPLAGTTG